LSTGSQQLSQYEFSAVVSNTRIAGVAYHGAVEKSMPFIALTTKGKFVSLG
jgi:hypothetical protein